MPESAGKNYVSKKKVILPDYLNVLKRKSL